MNVTMIFHPQVNRQFERTMQALESKLGACILDCKSSWIHYIFLIEFSFTIAIK
jgi:hypothetical protein